MMLVAVGFVAAGLSWTAGESTWPTQSLVLAVLAMVLGGFGLLIALRSLTNTPPVSVGRVWIVYFVATFGVASLGWLRHPPLSAVEVAPRNVVTGVLLCFLALLAWGTGYLVQPAAPLARVLRSLAQWAFVPGRERMRWRNAPLILYLVGMGARAIELATGRFGYFQDVGAALTSPSPWQQALSIVDGLTQLGLVLAALDAAYFSRTRRSTVVVVSLLIVESGVGMLSASKQSVLVALLTTASVYLGAAARIRWRLVVLCVVAAVFVFAVNSSYRSELRTAAVGRVPIGTVVKAFPRAVGATFSSDPGGAISDGLGRAASRIREVDNVALIVEKTPAQIPFESWETLTYGPLVGAIPRAIWPSKPVVSTGLDFSRQYHDIPDTVFTASAITTPGDLYRHGGLVPLGLGMMALGGIARAIDGSFAGRRDPRRLLVLVPVIVLLAKSESDFVSLLLGLVQTTLLAIIVSRVVFVRGAPVAQPPEA
jgi:hypothetical protein